MANKWNIPEWLEKEVRARDISCVYCGIKFENNSRDGMSWEHINNKGKDTLKWNIVLCCRSCNSSKGVKKLEDWFQGTYCLDNNINKRTVANIVRKYIADRRK